jgi:plastocyanin
LNTYYGIIDTRKSLIAISNSCMAVLNMGTTFAGLMKNRSVFLLGAAVAAGLLFAVIGIMSVPSAAQVSMNMTGSNITVGNDQSPSFLYKLDSKYHKYENGVFTVRAGGGGSIAPMTWFFPRIAEIKVGETVTWINPTAVGEPHTITFMMGNTSQADFAAPFVMSNTNTTFMPAVPNANADPVVMPGPNGAKIVVAANSRSISPTIIKADGNVTTLQPNTAYTMDGTEKFVNSGWMWPQGKEPQGFPPINTFSVKFTKAGTYDYMCEVHPWMTGQVGVK